MNIINLIKNFFTNKKLIQKKNISLKKESLIQEINNLIKECNIYNDGYRNRNVHFMIYLEPIIYYKALCINSHPYKNCMLLPNYKGTQPLTNDMLNSLSLIILFYIKIEIHNKLLCFKEKYN